MTIDTTNMCSHLRKKLFEPDGVYYPIWKAIQDDETLDDCGAKQIVAHIQKWEEDSHSGR